MIQKTNKNELRKTETKGRILWAAFKLFLAHGYHAVSFMSIEQVSQVTRGAIFYHFRNKEEYAPITLTKEEADNLEIIGQVAYIGKSVI